MIVELERPAGPPVPGPAAPPPLRSPARALARARPRRGLVPVAVLACSLACLGFAAFLLWGAGHQEQRAQSVLAADLKERIELAVALASAPTVDGQTTRLPAAHAGDALAFLEIPRIGLRRVVVEGSGSSELAKGPGHVKGTPAPGRIGNSVIFGHRTANGAAFRDLDRLERGDRIRAITTEGSFTYEVERTSVLKPGAADVFAQNQLNRLTLATAHPPHRAEGRLAVVARLVDDPVETATPPARLQFPDELGLAGSSSAWPSVIGWSLATVAAGFAAVRSYRRWPLAVAYLVTTPPLAAVLILLFESLNRLLPSTL